LMYGKELTDTLNTLQPDKMKKVDWVH